MISYENAKELRNLINRFLQSKEYNDIVSFIKNNDCEGINEFPDIERAIDNIAIFAGWIYDNTDKTSKNKITSKIRKALGYTTY